MKKLGTKMRFLLKIHREETYKWCPCNSLIQTQRVKTLKPTNKIEKKFKKAKIRLIKKNLDIMIIWIKKPNLLEEKPQLVDYKESRTESIGKNTIKIINLW